MSLQRKRRTLGAFWKSLSGSLLGPEASAALALQTTFSISFDFGGSVSRLNSRGWVGGVSCGMIICVSDVVLARNLSYDASSERIKGDRVGHEQSLSPSPDNCWNLSWAFWSTSGDRRQVLWTIFLDTNNQAGAFQVFQVLAGFLHRAKTEKTLATCAFIHKSALLVFLIIGYQDHD